MTRVRCLILAVFIAGASSGCIEEFWTEMQCDSWRFQYDQDESSYRHALDQGGVPVEVGKTYVDGQRSARGHMVEMGCTNLPDPIPD